MVEDSNVDTLPDPQPQVGTEERIRLVLEHIESGTTEKLTAMARQWSAGETASLIEALPQPVRPELWDLIPEELRGEVLAWLGDQVRASLLQQMDLEEAVAAASAMETPDLAEVAALYERRDLVSLPVVDNAHRLVGRIVLDDAIDLIRAEAEEPMMHMAGLEVDEDLLAPIVASVRRRLFWLGINLVTAFLAAWVIGLFETTLDKIVALAVLMPIVASMGGIAGSQTLTLAIRGLALGQITDANTRWLAMKEIAISVINGLVWALVVAVIAWFWFERLGISLILGAAMIVNLLVAALFGLIIPLILHRLSIAPALSGSVVLTTVTDVVGFMGFLGLATIFLL